jgi:uncharacterized membrane-anchored protein
MGVMAYIIAKHQQNYLDGIEGLKKLMIPSEVAVMQRLSKANQDFIRRSDKSFKKANIDVAKIEDMVLDMLDKIEMEFKNL